MSKRQPLSATELDAALNDLDGWQVVDGKLHKQFKFANFAAAMGWMVNAAIIIDKMNHHPEWSNVYNRVTVVLVTHDADNQISALDVELAGKLDAI